MHQMAPFSSDVASTLVPQAVFQVQLQLNPQLKSVSSIESIFMAQTNAKLVLTLLKDSTQLFRMTQTTMIKHQTKAVYVKQKKLTIIPMCTMQEYVQTVLYT